MIHREILPKTARLECKIVRENPKIPNPVLPTSINSKGAILNYLKSSLSKGRLFGRKMESLNGLELGGFLTFLAVKCTGELIE
jgi:hypothetical protein